MPAKPTPASDCTDSMTAKTAQETDDIDDGRYSAEKQIQWLEKQVKHAATGG